MELMEPVKKYRIYLAAVNAYFVNFILGTCVGWSSPVVPKLRDHTAGNPLDIAVTNEQEGWISSIISIGALIGCFILAVVDQRIGRKMTLLLSSIFYLVSYILLIFANKIWIIYVARALQGMGAGISVVTAPIYACEIATDDCRGSVGSLGTLLTVCGILYSYIIGPYVSYMALQLCCIVPPLIFLATFIFMPESPYYFAMKKRRPDGVKALKFLRGQSAEAVEPEMNQIELFVDESMANKVSFSAIFLNGGNRKALIICCGLLSIQQLSGTTAVTFNSQTIFSAAKTTLDPAIASIILPLVQLVSNSLTPFVVDRSGRKIIVLISTLGMCLAMFALGAFFYVQTFGDATDILWIPVPALIFFNVAYAFGIGPIPWAMLGEMFPSNVKSIATSMASSTCWAVSFFVTRWFPELNALGAYYAFWLFGSLCVLGVFFIIFYMIETKGLSFEKIREKLNE